MRQGAFEFEQLRDEIVAAHSVAYKVTEGTFCPVDFAVVDRQSENIAAVLPAREKFLERRAAVFDFAANGEQIVDFICDPERIPDYKSDHCEKDQ